MMITGVRLISQIKIGQRFRSDGDVAIESLAKSIKEVGLINAITIDKNDNLIAGWRRLRAHELLGIKQIPVSIVDSLDSAALALTMERDENTEREPMAPVDIVMLAKKLAEFYTPAATARQEAGVRIATSGSADTEEAKPNKSGRVRKTIAPFLGSGVSEATAGRYLAIGKNLESEDPIRREAAEEAMVKVKAGRGVERSSAEMNAKIKAANAAPMPLTGRALFDKMRRREELAQPKFQREIINDLLITGTSLITPLLNVANKLTTYGVHEEITPDERAKWLKDIARTRSALGKASSAIRGGNDNGTTE